jgi:hypothetical protein
VKHSQDVYLFAANAVDSEIVGVQNQFPRSINTAGLAWKVRGQHAHFLSELAHKTSRARGVVRGDVGSDFIEAT